MCSTKDRLIQLVHDRYLIELAAKSCDGYLDDSGLTAGERSLLTEYLTPRSALDGRIVWPVGELQGAANG